MLEKDPPGSDIEELFRAHRKRLWGLAYRLTGTSADADDVVQETFARLVERPAAGADPAIGGWLVRVATNLGIDALRARRRRAYTGPWLPALVEGEDDMWREDLVDRDGTPETRYDLRESVTFAFLLTLEALAPRQRAALLLRDVLGYSATETAMLLETTEGNVRVLHLRARRALETYDQSRCVPSPELRARHRDSLERLLGCLLSQDTRGLESILTDTVRTVTDANGEFTALATPLVGRARVSRFYLQASAMRLPGSPTVEIRTVNGMPAALITLAHPVRRQASRSVILLDLDEGGRIRTIHTVLAPEKLRGVR